MALPNKARAIWTAPIADFNRAIELDPKQPRAYMNRGFAKQAKGDHDGAIADYNRALELAAKLAKP